MELPELSDLFGKSGLNWLRKVELPSPDGALLKEDLQLLQTFAEKIASTEKLIEQLAKGDEAVPWLSRLPGIGKFLSVVIRWEVDNIERFREATKFARYTGLVPSTYASANRMVHGHLTKQGNKWLRWAFIEAVSPAMEGRCEASSSLVFRENSCAKQLTVLRNRGAGYFTILTTAFLTPRFHNTSGATGGRSSIS